MIAVILSAMLLGGQLAAPESPRTTLTEPDWLTQPDFWIIKRYYPDMAKRLSIGGYAELSCTITEAGGMTGCQVVEEAPGNMGFGAAALELADFFTLSPVQPDGQSRVGATVKVPLTFDPAEGNPIFGKVKKVEVLPADWTRMPNSVEMSRYYPRLGLLLNVAGRAELLCEATAEGALTNCRLQSESPAGFGFGAAALKASRAFRTRPTNQYGESVAGKPIRATIPFMPYKMDTAAPPPGAYRTALACVSWNSLRSEVLPDDPSNAAGLSAAVSYARWSGKVWGVASTKVEADVNDAARPGQYARNAVAKAGLGPETCRFIE
jgi:TonB family protein